MLDKKSVFKDREASVELYNLNRMLERKAVTLSSLRNWRIQENYKTYEAWKTYSTLLLLLLLCLLGSVQNESKKNNKDSVLETGM